MSKELIPEANETAGEFVGRCMADVKMQVEIPDLKARQRYCVGQWDEWRLSDKRRAETGAPKVDDDGRDRMARQRYCVRQWDEWRLSDKRRAETGAPKVDDDGRDRIERDENGQCREKKGPLPAYEKQTRRYRRTPAASAYPAVVMMGSLGVQEQEGGYACPSVMIDGQDFGTQVEEMVSRLTLAQDEGGQLDGRWCLTLVRYQDGDEEVTVEVGLSGSGPHGLD